jgi:hypothetical protein
VALPLLLLLAAPALREEPFRLAAPAEAVAVVRASCKACAWGVRGREAAVLVLELDGRYSQHLALLRGPAAADYAVDLGPLDAGSHALRLSLEPKASAPEAGPVRVESVSVRAIRPGDDASAGTAHAPFLFARPGTLEAFSDLPLVTWYEEDAIPSGRRLRYSVIFTNEDGGTETDRLMATWGRTTDVEFVYSVELDGAGRVVAETYQGKDHELLPFSGRHEGGHPLLWVVTDNNMVGEQGETSVRFAPAARPFDLAGRTREAVMDAEPWTYRVSSEEVRREGRVDDQAPPGSGRIPDPRRFAYLEACAPGEDAALSFALALAGPGGSLSWHASDAGGPRFRARREAHNFPNGCFQAAVPLPSGVRREQIRALRLYAWTRLPGRNEDPLPAGTGRARLVRVNRLFLLGAEDEPGPNLLSWEGDAPLVGEGAPFELSVSP